MPQAYTNAAPAGPISAGEQTSSFKARPAFQRDTLLCPRFPPTAAHDAASRRCKRQCRPRAGAQDGCAASMAAAADTAARQSVSVHSVEGGELIGLAENICGDEAYGWSSSRTYTGDCHSQSCQNNHLARERSSTTARYILSHHWHSPTHRPRHSLHIFQPTTTT